MAVFPENLARIWLIMLAVFVRVSIYGLNFRKGIEGEYNWAKNCDFIGFDIETVFSTNVECGGKCYDNPNCTHFSWNAGNCYLKHFEDQPTASDLHSIFCGWMSDGRYHSQIAENLVNSDINWQDDIKGIRWATACKFSGPDKSTLKSFNASVSTLCIDACVTLNECTHFNWDSGNCSLKHLDYAAPAYDFKGTSCGWVNRINPSQRSDGKNNSIPLPTELIWLDGNGGKVKWSMDCNFDGSDIAGIPGQGEMCGQNCVNNGNCTHFAWSYGTCYLKNFNDSVKLPIATRVVGNICGWVKNRP